MTASTKRPISDITLCGICGSDIASFRSGHLHSPAVCGHEWVGAVADIGGPSGEPDDYPGLVAFLASEDAAFMTGQTISVSGGLTMHG